jgi:hypothetical protein
MTNDPAPKRRWFRYGEPWGLLARDNPSATWKSVARRALLFGVTYPWLYAVVIYFRDEPTPHWPAKLAACAIGFMAIGALAEWQRDAIYE